MKRIKKYLYLIVAAGALVSCNDAIDITQPGEMTEELAFQSVADLQLGLNGVYSGLPGETEILFQSLFTDEAAIGVANGGQGKNGELAFLMNSNSGDATSIWSSYYRLIANTNRTIVSASRVTPATAAETVQYNHILAQLYSLRAYAHFKLLSYFSADLKNDNSLGVIKLDYVAGVSEKLPRNTTGEVFELINSDLDFALANFDPAMNVTTNRTYMQANFVTALKARIAAYRGDYAAAEGFADQLIALYPLTPKAGQAYQNIWRDIDGPTSEVIFKINREGGANWSQVWSSLNSSATGSAFFEVGRALFNLLDPNDVRRQVIVDPTAVVNPDYASSGDDYIATDILPVGKYSASEGIQLLADIKVFRVSEMYLIKAEARAAANDLAGAATAVRAIRSARFGSAQTVEYNNAEQAWAGILTERRIELAFEGHRYHDLKRLGTLANAQVDRDPMDCAWNGACTLATTDYRFVLPIPRSETSVNTNIRSQQNPGYND